MDAELHDPESHLYDHPFQLALPAEHQQPAREGEEWRSVNMTDTAFDHRPVITIEQGDRLLATAYSFEVAETIIRNHRLAALVPGLVKAAESVLEGLRTGGYVDTLGLRAMLDAITKESQQ